VNGKFVRFGTKAGYALLTQELNAALARFHAAGASRLVLLTYPPRASHSDQVVTTTLDRTLPPKLNRFFHTYAAEHPSDVIVVDLASIVCPGGWPCPEFVDGIRPRPRDGGHFEGAGPAWLAPKLVQAIIDGLRKSAMARNASVDKGTPRN
jgi:hypothetical protein